MHFSSDPSCFLFQSSIWQTNAWMVCWTTTTMNQGFFRWYWLSVHVRYSTIDQFDYNSRHLRCVCVCPPISVIPLNLNSISISPHWPHSKDVCTSCYMFHQNYLSSRGKSWRDLRQEALQSLEQGNYYRTGEPSPSITILFSVRSSRLWYRYI